MSNEYAAALEASRTAARIFMKAQSEFRTMKMGVAEFMKAQEANRIAGLAFDAACSEEDAREAAREAAPVVAIPSSQYEMAV